MDAFDRSDLDELLAVREANCVSVYLPTHPGSKEGEGDLIALRNLLDQAQEELVLQKVAHDEIDRLLASPRTLSEDKRFWNDRAEGLALFMTRDRFRCWRLPRPVEARTWVGNRFYLKPLFPLIDEAGCYRLLALSRKRARLFAGTHDDLVEVPVPGMPGGIEEVTDHSPPPAGRQLHTGQKALGGKEGVVFHGQGGSHDHMKRHDLQLYLRSVDDALRPILNADTAPLVLVGVEDLLPAFREVSSYPHLHANVIHGSPDHLNAAELRTLAAPLLETYWRQRCVRDRERCDAELTSGRVSADLEAVLDAADAGRVESIFVAGDVEEWGTWDAAKRKAVFSATRKPNDEDLLDLAAVMTYRQRGRVHVVNCREIPGGLVVAAIFRYAKTPQPLSAR